MKHWMVLVCTFALWATPVFADTKANKLLQELEEIKKRDQKILQTLQGKNKKPHWQEVLKNEIYLNGAIAAISKMEKPEMAAFLNYLSICDKTGLSENEAIRIQCSIAKEKYLIQSQRGRKLDILIKSLSKFLLAMSLIGDLSKENVSYPREKRYKDLVRYSFIMETLKRALNMKYKNTFKETN